QDVGTVVDSSNTGVPTLFLYDRYPGGVGFAAKGYELVEEILEACCELIHNCECDGGGPSCVGLPIPPYGHGEVGGQGAGGVPDKEAGVVILHELLGKEPYIPKRPKRATAETARTAFASGDGEAERVERPPSEPLPERLELRLRRQLARYHSLREGRKNAR